MKQWAYSGFDRAQVVLEIQRDGQSTDYAYQGGYRRATSRAGTIAGAEDMFSFAAS